MIGYYSGDDKSSVKCSRKRIYDRLNKRNVYVKYFCDKNYVWKSLENKGFIMINGTIPTSRNR